MKAANRPRVARTAISIHDHLAVIILPARSLTGPSSVRVAWLGNGRATAWETLHALFDRVESAAGVPAPPERLRLRPRSRAVVGGGLAFDHPAGRPQRGDARHRA